MALIPPHPARLAAGGPPDGRVSVPGSKSYTNRALVAAALAAGESRLRGVSVSDDSTHMVRALRRMGVSIDEAPESRTIAVRGLGGGPQALAGEFDVGNAGTAMRFLLGFASTGRGRAVLTGDARMQERPIQDLVDALAALGVRARCPRGNGCPPVEIEADGMSGGRATLRGGLSSQYLSALLLAAPAARGPVELSIEGPLTSRTYVEMTIATLRAFGARVEADGDARFAVDPARPYRARDYAVEPDAAGANYAFAFAAALGGRVRVDGLGANSVQGELRFADVLNRMGCSVARGPDWTEVRGGPLKGVDADLNALPDSVQTLAVLALFAEGPTTIRNVPNLRIKETDRLAALARELGRLGASVVERPDGLTVIPAPRYRPADIETYNDHRMVMSFALAAARIPGTTLANPACVAKSFPEFFEMLASLGIRCL